MTRAAWIARTLIPLIAVLPALPACSLPWDAEPTERSPHTIVLFATPKIISDFHDPAPSVAAFLEHYEPLTSRAAETVVIFAVGNSDHILRYRGPAYWQDEVEWARWIHLETEWQPVSEATLSYQQIAGVVQAFHRHAAATKLPLKVFDQFDKGREFAHVHWRFSRHPECMDIRWDAYNIRGRLTADDWIYASAPAGIEAGTPCGKFLVDQTGHYMRDLGFDGILYGNQLGTRGAWLPDNGPGYSDEEAAAIRDFLAYSREVYGDKGLMWFDSYNPIEVERATYSFPAEGYQYFDYIMASGFCVVSYKGRYLQNLASKITLRDGAKVLATLDYVDPWYVYDSMTDFPACSADLEEIAILNRDQIDGMVFFANDEWGAPVPRDAVESFAQRFFGN